MSGYLIRAQYLHDQGLVFAKVYIQDLNQKDVVGKADGVLGTMW